MKSVIYSIHFTYIMLGKHYIGERVKKNYFILTKKTLFISVGFL